MAGDAFAECLSTDGVEAFFQQCPATELTGPEVDLLNSLISVSESLQAALPRGVSLQQWAARKTPRRLHWSVYTETIGLLMTKYTSSMTTT